jgi:hypothetical protein
MKTLLAVKQGEVGQEPRTAIPSASMWIAAKRPNFRITKKQSCSESSHYNKIQPFVLEHCK